MPILILLVLIIALGVAGGRGPEAVHDARVAVVGGVVVGVVIAVVAGMTMILLAT